VRLLAQDTSDHSLSLMTCAQIACICKARSMRAFFRSIELETVEPELRTCE